MGKIKEVQQILNNHSLPTDKGGFIRDTADGSKFNIIARDIVQMFEIHYDLELSAQLKVFAEWYNNNTINQKISQKNIDNYLERIDLKL